MRRKTRRVSLPTKVGTMPYLGLQQILVFRGLTSFCDLCSGGTRNCGPVQTMS